jgi:acetyl-CoA C-acetyltransferase
MEAIMTEAFLVGGVRTPVGRYGGALSSVRPDDLAALVLREVVARTGWILPPSMR